MTVQQPELTLIGNDEYIVFQETVYQWKKGDAFFRIIIQPGQNTDLMSSPKVTELVGFKKSDPKTHLASKIHDFLCFHIRYNKGILPGSSYQGSSDERKWYVLHSTKWTYKEADQLFEKILIEQGFSPAKAKTAYLALRGFGWLHRLLNK